jgi:hypothetical protein
MMQPGNPNLDGILQALLGIAQAQNKAAKAFADAFPQGNTISATAGAPTGQYLAVVINGTTYKIALLANS